MKQGYHREGERKTEHALQTTARVKTLLPGAVALLSVPPPLPLPEEDAERR